MVLSIHCGIFQSVSSAQCLFSASSAYMQLPDFYCICPHDLWFCSLALVLKNEKLNDGQKGSDFSPRSPFNTNFPLNKVSRAARRATVSARVEMLATPKKLSEDYIPPREPAWSPKNVQSA